MTPKPGASLKEFYDADADRLEHGALRGLHHEVRFAKLLEGLDARPAGERWLDAPSGDGVQSAAIGRRHRAVAADLSLARVKRAKARGVRDAVCADLTALPFKPGAFDGAACLQAVEHLPDPVPALRELARVVRPGGSVVVETPSRTNLFNLALEPLADRGLVPRRIVDWGLRMDPGHVHFFRESELRRMLEAAGLRVARVVGAPILRWNLGVLRPLTERTPVPRLLERALAKVPVLNATGMIQAFWCRRPDA